MANQKNLAINFSQPILTSQAEEMFAKFSEVPLADVLVELFREVADPQTFRAGKEREGLKIYAEGPRRGNIIHSVSLEKNLILGKFGQVILTVYAGPLRLVPRAGFKSAACPNIVFVSAGAFKTGIWRKVKGNRISHGIIVSFTGSICLPSQGGKWLFNFLNRLAQLANEFYLDIDQQPEFWENEGRYGENRGLNTR